MSATETRQWITGEEFNQERRRLIAAGHTHESPEYQALLRKVEERNRHLFDDYGKQLIDRHPGKWVAISLEGDVIVADRDVEAMRLGAERFGRGNFCLARLSSPPGNRWSG